MAFANIIRSFVAQWRRLVCCFIGHRWSRDSGMRPDFGGMGEDANGHAYSWDWCSRCGRFSMYWLRRIVTEDEGHRSR